MSVSCEGLCRTPRLGLPALVGGSAAVVICVSDSVETSSVSAKSASARAGRSCRAYARAGLPRADSHRIALDDLLEIGRRGLCVVQRKLREGPAVERIRRLRLRGDDFVEACPRLRELVLEKQIAELLVVADRRVVDDRGLQLLDVPPARKT